MARRPTQPQLPSWQVPSSASRGEEWGHVQRWLDAYVSAWRSYDEDAIRALWSEDAIWYRPFGVRGRGRDAITAQWMAEEHMFQKGGYDAHYQPIAIDNGYVVTHGRTHFYDPAGGETRLVYDNICFFALAQTADALGSTSGTRQFLKTRLADHRRVFPPGAATESGSSVRELERRSTARCGI